MFLADWPNVAARRRTCFRIKASPPGVSWRLGNERLSGWSNGTVALPTYRRSEDQTIIGRRRRLWRRPQ